MERAKLKLRQSWKRQTGTCQSGMTAMPWHGHGSWAMGHGHAHGHWPWEHNNYHELRNTLLLLGDFVALSRCSVIRCRKKRMSGSQFLEVLERIGYPKTRVMDAQSFDWIFDNESLLPFLDWFCEEITESNVLDQEELER